ncbi:DUF2851 family protein [Luteolibacter pohnpeiensis]|uniref:DUF2851 family protein n=1 Tax=Luteolibacter pohnpeiensis TaxID=454153 RepID=A0A934VX63_9BACT|nr:DUF2851 family protein [Luteolibacter pohnpeiensis]MBK1883219.1 DUF2851 family protein [Luteolibacter pohnpeiensis]
MMNTARMTYSYLLESVWHPPLAFAEVAEKSLPSELELQALWFSGAFGREFRSSDGRAVRIVQFGEWNRSAGPDFSQAVVEIEGIATKGDLELDPHASDWETHGHSENPNFNQVVLHVVFHGEAVARFTRTAEHREVPMVVIPSARLEDALARPAREVAIARPGRCLAPLKSLPEAAVASLLDEAARHRAGLKATRFLRLIDAQGRDQALFQAVAETLGYRGNSLPMKVLSQRVMLRDLKPDPSLAEPLLFGTAGFLSPKLHEVAPPETKDYLQNLWETWWKQRAGFEVPSRSPILWKTHGQRPANHPHRRIGTLAVLTKEWSHFRKLALARPFNISQVLDFLGNLEHPFWSHHHTLGSSAAAGKIALFGKSQGLELLANHLIPLAMHEDGLAYSDYHKIRAATPNEKVKRCALRLFGSIEAAKPWLKRVCHHQGLMQIYQDFCLEDASDCAKCPFPEQLTQWK